MVFPIAPTPSEKTVGEILPSIDRKFKTHSPVDDTDMCYTDTSNIDRINADVAKLLFLLLDNSNCLTCWTKSVEHSTM